MRDGRSADSREAPRSAVSERRPGSNAAACARAPGTAHGRSNR
jgi:hypothetical protein